MTSFSFPIVESPEQSEADLCFCKPHSSVFGQKLYIDHPYEAKDDIKALETRRAYPKFDGEHNMWEIDFDAFAYAVERLSSAGYSISVTESCIDKLNIDSR